MFKQIKKVSESINNDRSPQDVMCSAMEEVGELAREVNIEFSNSHKKPGKDGVVGEIADSIICLMDLLHITHPELTEENFSQIIQNKLEKWKRKA